MVYTCNICNNTFTHLSNYKKHLNSKTSCDPDKKEQLRLEKLTCTKCKKVLSSTTRLKSHIEICDYEPTQSELFKQMIDGLTKQNELLSEKMDKQSEQMKMLMEKESKTININNNVTQQQYVYNIVPFGNEKFDYITNEEYNQIFEQGFRCLQMLIPLIYSNKSNPENMNVYISNYNDDKIRIFDGKDWIVEKKDYVLTNMYNSKRDFLELKFDDMYDSLSKNAKYFFKRFKKGNTNKYTIEPILDELKNILYVNRNYVEKKPTKQSQMITNSETTKKNNFENDVNDLDYIPNKCMFI